MLREVGIILLAVCAISLYVPLSWAFYPSSVGFDVAFILFIIVLAYAGYDIRRLIRNHEVAFAVTFLLLLIIAVVFSLVLLFTLGANLMHHTTA